MNNGIMNNEFTITMKFADLYELHGKGLLTKCKKHASFNTNR